MKPIFSFLIALLFLASCTKMENTEKVNVSDLNRKFIDAWNNKQTDTLKALLADDVHFLQGDKQYSGKSEVSDKWIDKTAGTISNLKTSTVSSAADNELAYEAGTFSVDVPAQVAGEPNAYGEGNFILLWKKDAKGKWKLSYAQLEDHNLKVKQ